MIDRFGRHRGRSAAGARSLAVAAAIAAASGFASCGSGDSPKGDIPDAADTPAKGLRLGELRFDRTKVIRADAISVPVGGASDRTKVTVEVRAKGAKDPLAGPVTATVGSDERVVPVPLTGAGRDAITGCGELSAQVVLRKGGGERLDSASVAPTDSGPPCGRFFGPDAPWNQKLADDAPLDPSSDALVGTLRAELAKEIKKGFGPDVNSGDFSTRVYTVPADQAKVDVKLPPEKSSFQEPFNGVPLPDDAKPAEGTDEHLVLYQPATDTMWEFFGLVRDSEAWRTDWGGRIDDVSRSAGVFEPGEGGVKYGATATGLALAGGLITPGDLERGHIDHALAFAIPKAMAGRFSLPAQRTDGYDKSPDAIPEGARFRLDPKLDISKLKLSPLSRMLAEALQRYGMILRDQSGVVTFYAQIPTTNEDYVDLRRAKAGKISGQLLAELPWEHLQLLRMDLRPPAGG